MEEDHTKKMEDDLKIKGGGKEDDLNKQKTRWPQQKIENEPINLIGCDNIVNSPTYCSSSFFLSPAVTFLTEGVVFRFLKKDKGA